MTIPLVYIAGPFRGKTPWDVECNVRRAEELALDVARLGAMPLCPHAATRFFDRQLTDEFWLAGTLEMLSRCDAIVLVKGWQRSSGTLGEVRFALANDIPIFYGFEGDDLAAFIKGVING